ncbi:cyclin-D1-binding protein 1 homolog [Selaginella moellendorffii]|uniref:cyclin-D1-binding protein 1 homolog n=1 Tax=Selaginella moellendorffii TaxID=88036 RepID=UPI000D1CD3D6|nr:cyclin-D1-binding protein 1 homolog [Selaginella moellendorffii]|eukprot:XP_024538630.1 cyclin-D1-binding protein 1 homolog [Selaginella moellendorffii]
MKQGRGKSGSDGGLLGAVRIHAVALRSTLEMLNEPAPSACERVPWSDVKKAAEAVSKEATTTGMLWSGTPSAQEAADKVESYINTLQGFLLLCHGSTVGAGPTLLSTVQAVAKGALESSLSLLESALSLGSQAARLEALPPLTGCVWEACELVLKAPSDNRTAVGRAIVQVGTSIKDVVREMNEIELERAEGTIDDDDGDGGGSGSHCSSEVDPETLSFDAKFSPGEMDVASAVKDVISAVLVVVRQLLYVVTKAQDTSAPGKLESLEKILEQARSIGVDVDELGASVYPPQEIQEIRARSRGIESSIQMVLAEVIALHGSVPDDLAVACDKSQESHLGLHARLLALA